VNPGSLFTLTLSPAAATITYGGSEAYKATGWDAYGNSLGDVTSSTTFSISSPGNCSGAACTPYSAGTHTVSGADGAAAGTASLAVNQASITVIASSQTVSYGVTIPSTLSAAISGTGAAMAAADGVTASATNTATQASNAGVYATTAVISDPNNKLGNYGVSYLAGTFTIGPFPESAVVTVTPNPQVYGGSVTFTATLSNPIVNGVPAAANATFSICGAGGAAPCQAMGTAPVSGGVATLTATLLETVSNALNPANSHTVAVAFGGVPGGSGGPDFTFSQNQPALTINPAQATPPSGWGTMYTGASVFWTPSQSSSTATLYLSTTVFDPAYPNCLPASCANITKGTVTFGIRSSSNNSYTPIAGATNLPIGLVNLNNPSLGSAAATVQYTIPGGANSANLQIAVIVSGYYTANDTTWDYLVTVALPPVSGSLVFGGTSLCDGTTPATVDPNQQNLPCSSSNGTYQYPQSGVLVGTAVELAQVQGGVKWSKSGSNPQGQILAQFVSYYLPNMQLDKVPHTYVIKSNAISTFVVSSSGTGNWAQFTSKASISDISTGASVDGGALLNVTVCGANATCPTNSSVSKSATFTAGPDGAISFQVNNSKTGGIWFVVGWNGGNSVPQNVVTGAVDVVP
jgi:hypothetical protein